MQTKSRCSFVQRRSILIGGIAALMLFTATVNADPIFVPFPQTACTIPNPIPAGDSAALIDAINCANSTPAADVINLTNSTYEFTSGISTSLGSSALPEIVSAATGGSLTVNGSGAIFSRPSASTGFRFFSINNGANVTLNNLTLNNGFSSTNGGAVVNGGTLTINGVFFQNNTAAASGGAIFTSFATVNINNSRLSGNTTQRGAGGALSVGITFGNVVTVTNSVFTGNSSPTDGGAIWNANVLIVNNSTLSGNTAARGGNLFNGRSNSVSVANTILTNGGSGGDCFNNSGTINMSYSLVTAGLGCVTGTNIANLTGSPGLGSDLIPTAGSPVINSGDPAFTSAGTDVRGDARVQGGRVDMGAYETGLTPTVTISAADANAAEPGIDTASVTITRTNLGVLSVTLSPGGSASSGDYALSALTPATINGTTVTIPAGSTSASVIITPVDDQIAEPGGETLNLTITDGVDYDPGTPNTASANIADDDNAGVSVTATDGSNDVVEGGATDTFSIVLTTQPSADVVVTLTGTQVTTTPTAVTFTAGNWSQTQEVTITAIDDPSIEGAHIGSVSFSLGGASEYVGLTITPLDVNITDNDSANVIVIPMDGLETTEAGGTADFTLALTSSPNAEVVITMISSTPTEGTVSPDTVTFDATNWDQPQTVTITGVDDLLDDGDTAYTITSTAVSTDLNFNGITIPSVSATNLDDDTAGIILTPAAFDLQEGMTGSYTIQLATLPNVVPITVLVEFPADQLEVDGQTTPFTLTFTDTTPQTLSFRVLVTFDINTTREITITHTVTESSALEYPVGVSQALTLSILDFPPPPPVPLCEDHNFDEGGVVRSSTSDALGYAINCRVLYQNGAPTTWLGQDLYSEANLGIPLSALGVQQAIDIFSPPGMTYFEGGAVFCLRGQGTLIWLAASGMPRHPEIIGSYTVPEFPGFTCTTLFEPGTLILVTDNPTE